LHYIIVIFYYNNNEDAKQEFRAQIFWKLHKHRRKYFLAFVSAIFTFFYCVVSFMVYGHIVYTWSMHYRFPELSNYSYPRQETTPLRDVQIRIFTQMPKVS